MEWVSQSGHWGVNYRIKQWWDTDLRSAGLVWSHCPGQFQSSPEGAKIITETGNYKSKAEQEFYCGAGENKLTNICEDMGSVPGLAQWIELWSYHGAVETNPSRNHEVAALIPGLSQWVKDLVLP